MIFMKDGNEYVVDRKRGVLGESVLVVEYNPYGEHSEPYDLYLPVSEIAYFKAK